MAVPAGHTPYIPPAVMPQTVTTGGRDDEEFYNQLLRLRDAVVEGKHPKIKLPPAAIQQLKSTMASPANKTTAVAANDSQSSSAQPVQPVQPVRDLPGLASKSKFAEETGLGSLLTPSDTLREAEARLQRQRFASLLIPSDHLREAEARLQHQRLKQKNEKKREHIERGFWLEIEQNRTRVPKILHFEDTSNAIDTSAVLLDALLRVPHVSGLKPSSRPDSSFDENDYYSSQVQSEWSSAAEHSPASDVGADAPLNAPPPQTMAPTAHAGLDGSRQAPVKSFAPKPVADQGPAHYLEGDDGDDEDDEEYDPGDAAAFDSFQGGAVDVDGDDSDSDYEPGPVAAGLPLAGLPAAAQVPVIHNRLTHLAAPQPNRISPFATASAQNLDLGITNSNTRAAPHAAAQGQSRASTMSPADHTRSHERKHGTRGTRGTKKTTKKRKTESINNAAISKKRRFGRSEGPPLSPKMISQMQSESHTRGAGMVESAQQGPTAGYNDPSPQSRMWQNEYRTGTPVGYASSPSAARYAQRDTADLRRTIGLQHARRLLSPEQRSHTPVATPYQQAVRQAVDHHVQYAPVGAQPYQVPSTPSMMPPPVPRVLEVEDQFGNRYVAAGPAPTESAAMLEQSRASIAPQPYDRAPSRATYAQAYVPAYDTVHNNMDPPPTPGRYDGGTQRAMGYGYEMLGPQGAESDREQSSSVYAPLRSYSVRPEAMSGNPASYGGQRVAPSTAVRASSVMPQGEVRGYSAHPEPQHQSYGYGYAPAARTVKYVDQYGNEVFPEEVRQVSYGYRG